MRHLTIVSDNRGMKLCGARIWARWRLEGKPLYDLWEYCGIGIGPGPGAPMTHRFMSYKPKVHPPVMIYMTMEQLTFNAQHFRPFAIDTREV